jgi:hypothetical protein
MEQNQNSIEKEIFLLFEAVNLFQKTTTTKANLQVRAASQEQSQG